MKLSFVPKSLLMATVLSILSASPVVVDAKLMSFMNPFEQQEVGYEDSNAAAGRSLSQHENIKQHAQEMKQLLKKRRLEAALREIEMKRQRKMSGQTTNNNNKKNTMIIQEPANDGEFHRGLSSKKSGSMSNTSSKSGKGSKKTSKKSSGMGSASKGQMVVATHPPTPSPTPPPTMMTMTAAPTVVATTPPPVMSSEDQGPISSADDATIPPDINNTPPPIVSEDQKDPGDIDHTPPPIASEDQKGPISDDFRAPPAMIISSEDQQDQGPISSVDDAAAPIVASSEDTASSDAAQGGGQDDSNASDTTPPPPPTGGGGGGGQEPPPTAGDSQGSDQADGTADANDEPTSDEPPTGDSQGSDPADGTADANDEPDADQGDTGDEPADYGFGDAVNNADDPPVEILTDMWEFAMVRTEASSADSEEDFNMTSVIVMAGVIYDFTADGSVNLERGVGEFSAICYVVSMDHDVLCTYKIHLATADGSTFGIGELIARGHVVDHQNENLALVTGTSFDFAQYGMGGTLVMQPNRDDPLTLTCSLTLRKAKDAAIN